MTEIRVFRRQIEVFDYEAFRRLVEPLGYRTKEQQRDFLGTTESTFWRARNEEPSDAFVGLTLRALSHSRYVDLFATKDVIDTSATIGVS